jgi:hypothetical protein
LLACGESAVKIAIAILLSFSLANSAACAGEQVKAASLDPYSIVSTQGPPLLTPSTAVGALVRFVRNGSVFGKGICKCAAKRRRAFFATAPPGNQVIDVRVNAGASPLTFHETPTRDHVVAEFVIMVEPDRYAASGKQIHLLVRWDRDESDENDHPMITFLVPPKVRAEMETP